MREFSMPAPETGTWAPLAHDPLRWAALAPARTLLSRRHGDAWRPVTAAAFREQVRGVAAVLIAAGIQPGDRVALWSSTRYEWTVLDYALGCLGAVSVPVYETAPASEVAAILADCGARALVAESRSRIDRLEDASAALDLKLSLDPRLVWTLAEVSQAAGRSAAADSELDRRLADLGPDDLATIVYTSGTTGPPKGCMLTHGNLVAAVTAAVAGQSELFDGEDPATLLFLPLAHIFARLVQWGAVRAGVRLGHSNDVTRLEEDLRDFDPSFVLAVPRVFERTYNTAAQRAVADGRGARFDRATNVAIRYSRALDNGRMPLSLRAEHALYERTIYPAIRTAFGARCAFAIAGGAPLGERLAHFYRGAGLRVLEGYGVSEAGGALAANDPAHHKIGTVGRPLPGVSVRVAADGELLFSGPSIFAGYWDATPGDSPEGAPARANPVRQGWLHTGDCGEIDEEGFIRVTGRLQELLVTAGGKRVSPTFLEDRLRAHPLVGQALVVGEGRPFVGAVISLDAEEVLAWARTAGHRAPSHRAQSLARLSRDPELLAQVQVAVDQANQGVSPAEAIRRFIVVTDPWTEEGGQLTASLKLRRNLVQRRHAEDIAALYLP